MDFTNLMQSMIKNVSVSIGGREMRCECTDPECPNNSHKVDLKHKFLSSICANDVNKYDKHPGFSQIQCYWSNSIVRTAEEQRKYDFHIEEMLQKENIKDMNIKELREFYPSFRSTLNLSIRD